MIEKLIEYSARNRFIVILLTVMVIGWGIWSMYRVPIDAIPDLSDNQVIVYTEWDGRGPQIIEDQITYPLASNLQGLPRVKAVRATSMFEFSMIYIIFEDDVDLYWARSRVLERLNSVRNLLPENVSPTLGPDGTGVGHVYWYTLKGKNYSLADLRALQDWYIRYQLNSVEGVAEVASIGGFVRQYQIDIDPEKLRAYQVNFNDIVENVRKSNRDVGARLLENNDREYIIRGLGYIKSIGDIENIIVGYRENRVPIFIKNIGVVQVGGDLRRGLLDENGQGEVVGGIIVMRQGENAKDVIDRVKAKITELSKGLPEGVTIETAYDRSDLIEAAVDTVKTALIEEGIIVSIVILLFLAHIGSSFLIILTIPISVLISFIFMKYFGVSSNLMSLGGIIIAIGDLADSAIVMVENAYRNLSMNKDKPYREVIIESAQQVGRPIFFSILVIIVSFAPVFLLEGQEGRLFAPLAYTKTFAMVGAAILTITLVPVLMTILLKGKIRPEQKNPVSRFFIWLYTPALRTALKFKKITLLLSVIGMLLIYPISKTIGTEFMPPLDEGSLLFMPTMLPDINITEAKRILQLQDRIIKAHPEVKYVLGKIGRADTSTDPAPVSMVETIIILKPKSEWRAGITKNDIISELNEQLRIPGVSNAWTQPIINRINMLATGVRTELGLKIYGNDLKVLEGLAAKAENILREIPGAADLYAERTVAGKFIDIQADRLKAARYGVSTGDIQDIIEAAIGGSNVSSTVEGRERFPVRVRYMRDYRDSLKDLERIYVPTPSGPIPLTQLTTINVSSGPTMINSENSLLRAIVILNVRDRDTGSFVKEAAQALNEKLDLPPGYYTSWSGQYESQVRAAKRLQVVIPVVLMLTIIFLYFTFNSIRDTMIVILSIPFASLGGVILMSILDYNFSVAVWVGFIALTGIAVETGVVMMVYLDESLQEKLREKQVITKTEFDRAVMEGAALRLRPKLMTTLINLVGLIPVMLSTGVGSDVMKPLATPLIGGIISSTILVLIVLPVIFSLVREHSLKKNNLLVKENSI